MFATAISRKFVFKLRQGPAETPRNLTPGQSRLNRLDVLRKNFWLKDWNHD